MEFSTKAAMSPEDCGRYLSARMGLEITAQDVLHYIAEGRLTPSWFVQGMHVQEVFPVSRLWGGWLNPPAKGLPPWELKGVLTYERGRRDIIEWLIRVPPELNPILHRWAQAAAAGKTSGKVDRDGIIIRDQDGSLWQLLTDFGEGYSKLPLCEPLPMDEVVIQQRDADAFIAVEQKGTGLDGSTAQGGESMPDREPVPGTAGSIEPDQSRKIQYPKNAAEKTVTIRWYAQSEAEVCKNTPGATFTKNDAAPRILKAMIRDDMRDCRSRTYDPATATETVRKALNGWNPE